MIDRLKERIAELEQTNAVLQTLLACAIAVNDDVDDREVWIPSEVVMKYSGRTITSEPVTFPETGEVQGVYIRIDPVDLPDFGGDMQGLLAREDRH
jgi:hypothetical protein